MEVLIISPFRYALERQTNKIREKLFCKDVECRIHSIQALPDEIEDKILGNQYDYAYIDSEYISEEVGKIRDQLCGRKTIERF